MNDGRGSSTALSATDATHPGRKPASPTATPPRPDARAPRARFTAGRITALALGGLLVLLSVCLLSGGAVALWASHTQRDASYVTTGVHAFSTPGSALATAPVDLDSPGVGWLYSSALLGRVRVRVAPASTTSELFVGIGPTDDVGHYLAGVKRTTISDFWSNNVQAVGGRVPRSAPATQDFWVASATGPGTQTLTWDPANGSWTVVVMNADGRPGVDVRADLGATYPALPGLAVGVLIAGGLSLVGGVLLIAAAIRRPNAESPSTAC